MKKRILLIIMVVFMTIGLCSCTETDTETVKNNFVSPEVISVKDGILEAYSAQVTVGEAIDAFLLNPEWEYFVADTGEDIVECKGNCTYNDEDATVRIQFKLNNDDTFEFYALALNDLSQEISVAESFLNTVYEDYL